MGRGRTVTGVMTLVTGAMLALAGNELARAGAASSPFPPDAVAAAPVTVPDARAGGPVVVPAPSAALADGRPVVTADERSGTAGRTSGEAPSSALRAASPRTEAGQLPPGGRGAASTGPVPAAAAPARRASTAPVAPAAVGSEPAAAPAGRDTSAEEPEKPDPARSGPAVDDPAPTDPPPADPAATQPAPAQPAADDRAGADAPPPGPDPADPAADKPDGPGPTTKDPAQDPTKDPAQDPAVKDPGASPPTSAAQRYGWGTPLPGSDEFDYTGPPDPAKWNVAGECWAGHAGNAKRCASRSRVDGSKLVQTGQANGDSAWVGSRTSLRYGRWEARVRSTGTGPATGRQYHPLLIVWPTSNRWPQDGEYDFLENGAPGQDCAESFIHYPHDAGLGVQQVFTKEEDCGEPLTEWHDVAFEWTPDHVRGYVDGKRWFDLSGGATGGRQKIQDMPAGHLTIQLDNFFGGGMQPATYEVDWVRIYRLP